MSCFLYGKLYNIYMFKGNKEGRKRPTPMRETGTLPKASATKRTPRPLTLGLAKDSMSMLEDT